MDCEYVEPTNTDNFINKLLCEMKNQFNKAEALQDCESSPKNEEIESGTIGPVEKETSINSRATEINTEDSEVKPTKDIEKELNCPDDIPNVIKSEICSRRSPRSKLIPNTEATIKRSSRRRSKDCESVLQSAIARKEKSYNESNKPQRLSRQLKPTVKILENLALAKKEKSRRGSSEKVKMERNGDKKTFTKNKQSTGPSKEKKIKLEVENDVSLESPPRSPKDCSRRSHRINSQIKEETKQETDLNENGNFLCEDLENQSVTEKLIASRLCLCVQKSNLYVQESNETVYCSAVDSIDLKLYGCSKAVDLQYPMLRPSSRVPYMVLCNIHRNRLLRHNCCPFCGIFCTQGEFVECSFRHQYHRNCQIAVGERECCPHCGKTTPKNNINIVITSPKKLVFLEKRPGSPLNV